MVAVVFSRSRCQFEPIIEGLTNSSANKSDNDGRQLSRFSGPVTDCLVKGVV